MIVDEEVLRLEVTVHNLGLSCVEIFARLGLFEAREQKWG